MITMPGDFMKSIRIFKILLPTCTVQGLAYNMKHKNRTYLLNEAVIRLQYRLKLGLPASIITSLAIQ